MLTHPSLLVTGRATLRSPVHISDLTMKGAFLDKNVRSSASRVLPIPSAQIFMRSLLVSVPAVGSLSSLNIGLPAAGREENGRSISKSIKSPCERTKHHNGPVFK